MVWILRREYRASERIVSQCRIFLSKRKIDDLRRDLRVLYNRETRLDPFQRREQAAALVVQKTYRSFAIRKYLRDSDFDVSVAIEKSTKERRIRQRQLEIHEIEHTQTLFQKLISFHMDDLERKRLQFISKREKIEVRQRQIPDHQQGEDLRERIQGKVGNYIQIVAAIDDQINYVEKLRVKSEVCSEHIVSNLKKVQGNFNSVKSVLDFITNTLEVGREISSTACWQWVESEKIKMMNLLIGCDMDQDRILFEDQRRLNGEIQSLLDSYALYSSKVKMLEKLEGWEEFGYSLDIFVASKNVESHEADNLLKWLKDNEEKMNNVEQAVEGILDEVHSFYYNQDSGMAKSVVFHTDASGIQAVCKKPQHKDLSNFDEDLWMSIFRKQPWVQLQERADALKRFKMIQQHIRIRRNELFSNTIQGQEQSNAENSDGLNRMINIPDVNALSLIVKKASRHLHRIKQGRQKIGIATKSLKTRLKTDLHRLSETREMRRESRLSPLPTSFRGDRELGQMVINLKKMNKRKESSVAICTLQFTVGRDETDNMVARNTKNADEGRAFFQNRLELGRHTQVVLWIRFGQKVDEFITSIVFDVHEEKNVKLDDQGYTFVGHERLAGGLWVRRDFRQKMVISGLQLAYANSGDSLILQKDYDRIPCCLSALDNFVVKGNMWISMKERYEKEPSNIDVMEKQLKEYQTLLSKKSTGTDLLMQNLVTEMERRINVAKRKEIKQIDSKANDIDYIKEFLVMGQKEIRTMERVFNKIDYDRDSVISIKDLVDYMKSPNTMVSVIRKILSILLEENQTIDMLEFGRFVRSLSSFAMMGREEVIKIAFNAIDEESYGYITQKHYVTFFDMLHCKGTGISYRALGDDIVHESISLATFEELQDKYPSAMFPLFNFQQSVRRSLLGLKYWTLKMRKYHQAQEMVRKEKALFNI